MLNIIDSLLTPDLGADRRGGCLLHHVLAGGALVVVMLMIQLGLAAIRRNAKSLALVLFGLGQFLVVWAGWIGLGVAVVVACRGRIRADREPVERHNLVGRAAAAVVQGRRHHRW